MKTPPDEHSKTDDSPLNRKGLKRPKTEGRQTQANHQHAPPPTREQTHNDGVLGSALFGHCGSSSVAPHQTGGALFFPCMLNSHCEEREIGVMQHHKLYIYIYI